MPNVSPCGFVRDKSLTKPQGKTLGIKYLFQQRLFTKVANKNIVLNSHQPALVKKAMVKNEIKCADVTAAAEYKEDSLNEWQRSSWTTGIPNIGLSRTSQDNAAVYHQKSTKLSVSRSSPTNSITHQTITEEGRDLCLSGQSSRDDAVEPDTKMMTNWYNYDM